jgi:hypothetical protein
VDLPTILSRRPAPALRRVLRQHLATAVAAIHDAGFTQPDLYAKHIFVRPMDLSVAIIDFQRTRWRRRVGWRARLRDLAALAASLSGAAVSRSERLAFLRSYLAATPAGPRQRVRPTATAVDRRCRHLLRRRKVQAMRAATARPADPAVITFCRVRVEGEVATDASPEAQFARRGVGT